MGSPDRMNNNVKNIPDTDFKKDKKIKKEQSLDRMDMIKNIPDTDFKKDKNLKTSFAQNDINIGSDNEKDISKDNENFNETPIRNIRKLKRAYSIKTIDPVGRKTSAYLDILEPEPLFDNLEPEPSLDISESESSLVTKNLFFKKVVYPHIVVAAIMQRFIVIRREIIIAKAGLALKQWLWTLNIIPP